MSLAVLVEISRYKQDRRVHFGFSACGYGIAVHITQRRPLSGGQIALKLRILIIEFNSKMSL
ncbi:hypothetical protein O206_08675 [Ochrobactrum sp. EGD-AQ16]|nr:hypothetical protein O206_08675 [Ochrobactrum sp. EGD-AQ16]OAE39720.1 hypothetical protein A7J42_14540 [Brucella intermedia]